MQWASSFSTMAWDNIPSFTTPVQSVTSLPLLSSPYMTEVASHTHSSSPVFLFTFVSIYCTVATVFDSTCIVLMHHVKVPHVMYLNHLYELHAASDQAAVQWLFLSSAPHINQGRFDSSNQLFAAVQNQFVDFWLISICFNNLCHWLSPANTIIYKSYKTSNFLEINMISRYN